MIIRRQDAIDAIYQDADATYDAIMELPSADGYIDRAELFNKLAEIKAPPEANDYKAQVYALIQSM